MADSAQSTKIQVFYDGLCRVCSAEIETYRRMRGADGIDFVDITSPQFSAEKEGLDPFLVHKELHARTSDGQIVKGVETFILIWKTLPSLNWLARLAAKSPVRSFLNVNYRLFVKVRPYLPRKSCEQSPYCEIKRS